MNDPISKLPEHYQTPEEYFLWLMVEENSEVNQLIGKAGRFGMDTPGVKDVLTGDIDMTKTPRDMLHKEIGDVFAAARYAHARNILDMEIIEEFALRKLTKLLDPESKDNLGRRLAP